MSATKRYAAWTSSAPVTSQSVNSSNHFSSFTTAAERSTLTILASDEYEGRETGKKGQKMAAKYISERFKEFGFEGPVDGSYYQSFDLKASSGRLNISVPTVALL